MHTSDNENGIRRITRQPQRVFGPMVWPAIHIIALNYPHNPTEIVQYACSYFLQALPIMLPCSHCGHDLLEFLRQGNDEYAPRSVETICASRESLFGTVAACTVHHTVSIILFPCAKPFRH